MITKLEIRGLVQKAGSFSLNDLAVLPGRIADVSAVAPGRQGSALPLASLVSICNPLPNAKYLTLEADDFSASVELAPVLPHGLIIYGLAGESLPESLGGPFRFLIPDVTACATGGVDQCANVKFLRRITFSAKLEQDTRPSTPRAHVALHEAQDSPLTST